MINTGGDDWFDQNPPPGRDWITGSPGFTEPTGSTRPNEDPTQTPPPDPTQTPMPTDGTTTTDTSFPAPTPPNPSDYPAPTVPGMQPAPAVPTPPGMPDPLAPWTGHFDAPTKDSILNDPEFQARLSEGIKTIQRSAAAKGTLLTGGTVKGLEDYGQQQAGLAYGNAYGRAADTYDKNRTDFLTNEANRFTSQKSNIMDNWQNQMNQYQMARLNRGDTFDESAALFGMDNTNRMNSWGIGSDYFNMGNVNRMNDFSIFNTTDMNNWKKQMDIANLGKPQQPNLA